MADKPFRCKLITPESRVFDAQVSYASVPMWDGARGFLASAGAVVGKLGAGALRVEFVDRYELGVKLQESGSKRWFLDGGFMQFVDNTLTILASGAIEASELNEAKASAELAQAEAQSSTNLLEMDRITAARSRARAKLAMVHSQR